MTNDYTGLAVTAWELFSGEAPGRDHPHFLKIIRESGLPALDVGCATGRLLLPYLESGLDMDGCDPSEDMIQRCRVRVECRGLTPNLYVQSMQALDLPRRYRTIIVPCGTIQLVVDRELVEMALRRLFVQLEPGGILALTVFNRWTELAHEVVGEWVHRATQALPDGTELSKHARIVARDFVEQTLSVQVRYRLLRGGRIVQEQVCDASERWYFRHEMALMLEKAGFKVREVLGDYSEEPFADGHEVMTFIARKSTD